MEVYIVYFPLAFDALFRVETCNGFYDHREYYRPHYYEANFPQVFDIYRGLRCTRAKNPKNEASDRVDWPKPHRPPGTSWRVKLTCQFLSNIQIEVYQYNAIGGSKLSVPNLSGNRISSKQPRCQCFYITIIVTPFHTVHNYNSSIHQHFYTLSYNR